MKKPIVSICLCWLAYACIYIGRLNVSIASPLMEESGIMTSAGIGALGSCFFFSYAFGQIINGYIGDYLSPRIMIFTGLLLAGLSNIMMGIMRAWGLYLFWAVNGYAQSMIWGPILRIASFHYHDPDKRSRAVIILSVSIGLGSIMALVMAVLLSVKGYAPIFFVPGAILMILSLLCAVFLPAVNKNIQTDGHIKFLSLFKNRELLKMLIPSAAHGIIKDNLNLWVPLFFTEAYNIDIASAAFYIFLIPSATFAGRLLFPALYRLCAKDEKLVSVIAFILCALALIPIIAYKLPIWAAAACLGIVAVTISIINAAFLSIYPLRFSQSNNISSVTGIMDFVTYMGAAGGSALFGVLISASGYRSMLIIWLALAAVSAGGLIYGRSAKARAV